MIGLKTPLKAPGYKKKFYRFFVVIFVLPNSRFWQVPKIIYPNNIQKLYSRKQVQKLQEIYICIWPISEKGTEKGKYRNAKCKILIYIIC